MGLSSSKGLFGDKFSKETKILMTGMDAAGKTTIIYKMKLGNYLITKPILDFGPEELKYKNLSMFIWYVGGTDPMMRKRTEKYYEGAQALIFVVDSSDLYRIEDAKEELHVIMSNPSLAGVKLLVFANKTDAAKFSVKELEEQLQLSSLKADWHIQGSCAVTGEGLSDGFDWVTKAIEKIK